MSEVRYLLWANDRQMWWRTGGWGYTPNRAQAGRFSEAEAIREVVNSADAGRLDEATVMIAESAVERRVEAAAYAAMRDRMGGT